MTKHLTDLRHTTTFELAKSCHKKSVTLGKKKKKLSVIYSQGKQDPQGTYKKVVYNISIIFRILKARNEAFVPFAFLW